MTVDKTTLLQLISAFENTAAAKLEPSIFACRWPGECMYDSCTVLQPVVNHKAVRMPTLLLGVDPLCLL